MIYIIRHAKVNMRWPSKCNSAGFDAACTKYESTDISDTGDTHLGQYPVYGTIYISDSVRCLSTARLIYPNREYSIWPDIKEVPLASFCITDNLHHLFVWNIMGRIQWYLNNSAQSETRRQTIKRADGVIKALEQKDEDVIMITHGFFMKTLVGRLKKNGYIICGNKLLGFKNLHMITADLPHDR